MSEEEFEPRPGDAGAFGVNYALRPHKYVDRRVFVEILSRYAAFVPVENHVYVGLGSYALEDHKLINATFGTQPLISLEIDANVVARQKFNTPLACIHPTQYSTEDFVVRKSAIFNEFGISPDANSIVWFDMTDAATIRAHLDTFSQLLGASQPADVLRITVDIDEKTLGRLSDGESLENLEQRRFVQLSEFLGGQLKPGARVKHLSSKLGIAKLVSYAFKLVAEEAFERDQKYTFEPLSLTTYADGHRMLSITGVVVERDKIAECRTRMRLGSVPGGVAGWDDCVDIQIPQLTVWEKLSLDRDIHKKSPRQLARAINFKLHESIPTIDLLKGYTSFQRFYPTFRHVAL